MSDEKKNAYDRLSPALARIDAKAVARMNMPLEVAAAEASRLVAVAREDREELLGAGIDPDLLGSLGERANAFVYAAARFLGLQDADPAALRRWRELREEGVALQQYLFKHMTFAYRKYPSLRARLANIKRGRGASDMILDLLSVGILAEENPEPLRGMPAFDMSKIEEAKRLNAELAEAYALAVTDPRDVDGAKDAMLRAYTHYKRAANEVMEHGRFVFEGAARCNEYKSAYRRKNARKAARSSDTPPEAEE